MNECAVIRCLYHFRYYKQNICQPESQTESHRKVHCQATVKSNQRLNTQQSQGRVRYVNCSGTYMTFVRCIMLIGSRLEPLGLSYKPYNDALGNLCRSSLDANHLCREIFLSDIACSSSALKITVLALKKLPYGLSNGDYTGLIFFLVIFEA